MPQFAEEKNMNLFMDTGSYWDLPKDFDFSASAAKAEVDATQTESDSEVLLRADSNTPVSDEHDHPIVDESDSWENNDDSPGKVREGWNVIDPPAQPAVVTVEPTIVGSDVPQSEVVVSARKSSLTELILRSQDDLPVVDDADSDDEFEEALSGFDDDLLEDDVNDTEGSGSSGTLDFSDLITGVFDLSDEDDGKEPFFVDPAAHAAIDEDSHEVTVLLNQHPDVDSEDGGFVMPYNKCAASDFDQPKVSIDPEERPPTPTHVGTQSLAMRGDSGHIEPVVPVVDDGDDEEFKGTLNMSMESLEALGVDPEDHVESPPPVDAEALASSGNGHSVQVPLGRNVTLPQFQRVTDPSVHHFDGFGKDSDEDDKPDPPKPPTNGGAPRRRRRRGRKAGGTRNRPKAHERNVSSSDTGANGKGIFPPGDGQTVVVVKHPRPKSEAELEPVQVGESEIKDSSPESEIFRVLVRPFALAPHHQVIFLSGEGADQKRKEIRKPALEMTFAEFQKRYFFNSNNGTIRFNNTRYKVYSFQEAVENFKELRLCIEYRNGQFVELCVFNEFVQAFINAPDKEMFVSKILRGCLLEVVEAVVSATLQYNAGELRDEVEEDGTLSFFDMRLTETGYITVTQKKENVSPKIDSGLLMPPRVTARSASSSNVDSGQTDQMRLLGAEQASLETPVAVITDIHVAPTFIEPLAKFQQDASAGSPLRDKSSLGRRFRGWFSRKGSVVALFCLAGLALMLTFLLTYVSFATSLVSKMSDNQDSPAALVIEPSQVEDSQEDVTDFFNDVFDSCNIVATLKGIPEGKVCCDAFSLNSTDALSCRTFVGTRGQMLANEPDDQNETDGKLSATDH